MDEDVDYPDLNYGQDSDSDDEPPSITSTVLLKNILNKS